MPPIDRRIGLLFAAFLLLLGAAAARAAYFGSVRAPALQRAATTQQVEKLTLPAPRGTITDRKGVELAVSEAAADVSADPYIVKDPQTTARKLAPLLGRPVPDVLEDLTKPRTGFVYLARRLPATQAQKIQKLDLPGIQTTPDSRRVYPRDWLASQVLGFVGTDGHGLAGLEYGEDDRLGGRDGVRRVVKDALGQPIQLQDVKPAVPGDDIRLTIDAAIQDKVEQVLEGVGEEYTPKGATAVVMDPRDGSVLALANWPRVDANDVAGAPAYARQDRAIGVTYEPGSTFKAITVAGALEDGEVTPDTTFQIPPQYQVADRVLHDAEAHGYETLTVAQILQKSSNIGAVKIAQQLGKVRFDHWVRTFGFGKPTGIDLPGEEQGLLLTPDEYSGSSIANLPIGQGELVTPMQMATAYAAIANGGILRPPHVIAGVDGHATSEPKGHRIISERTASQIRTMLEGVLADGGTASGVDIPGYTLAGKTGTANKVDPVTHTYSDTKYVASFVGFAPARDPKILVAVMVDEPQGGIYGGQVAAPAFQDILEFALPYLRIGPG